MRILLALPLALAACTPPPPPQAPDVVISTCNPAGYDDFIGQSEDVFASATLPTPMRIIRPGQAVTLDFNPNRLNFTLGNDGTITTVYCG